jgi:regulator of PEP synthase PpsR (kinase-PPPase family)
MKIDQGRIVGLILDAERLVELRHARLKHQDAPFTYAYADLEQVRSELRYSRSLFRKAGWPVIDMTNKSIEEAASEVIVLIATHEASGPVPDKGPRPRLKKAAKDVVSRRVQGPK